MTRIEEITQKLGGEWRWIPGYENFYALSLDGRVASWRPGENFFSLKAVNVRHDGYLFVVLYKNTRRKTHMMHRLLLETFTVPCPPGWQADHINNNRSDNRLDNLQWVSQQQNLAFRKTRGTLARGSHAGQSLLSEEQVAVIKNLLANGVSGADLSMLLRVSVSTISYIKKGKSWNHVENY